ncbi:MAG: hypothetical protein HY225_04240 [Candidatus Vogelbacteria bacterium]|nr:hypothetical protein [Candidatus Vogelbacteria bacterium]
MNYDESLEFKLSISDPLRIVTAYVGVYGHDEAYISERSGTKEVVASIVSFPLDITDKKLDEWAVKTRVRFAEAKELVELLRVVPRPGLDKTLPLYALGNSAKAGEENLILRASIGDDDERNVNNTLYEKNPPYWKHTTTTWTNSQFFLVIEDDGVPEPTK